MKLSDLIACAWHNLWVRKLRTALNLVGIVISCLLVLSTISAARGIQLAIQRFVENSPEALRFRIVPTYDTSIEPPAEAVAVAESMSDDRKERMRELLKRRWQQKNLPRPRSIKLDVLQDLEGIDHVSDVVPNIRFNGQLIIGDKKKSVSIGVASMRDQELSSRIVCGSPLTEASSEGVLLHEVLAFEMGFRSDESLQSLIGQTVNIEFRQTSDPLQFLAAGLASLDQGDQSLLQESIAKLLAGESITQLTAEQIAVLQRLATTLAASREKVEKTLPKGAAASRRLRVAGVFRNRNQDDQSNILTRFLSGSEQVLVQHAQLRPVAESLGKNSVGSALVYIDQFDVLDDVDEELRQRNMATISATGTIKRLYDSIDRSEVSILLAASVIFLVAAIGISNTMIISVVERSEEIGILKAVGASNRQVTLLVMFECLMTGFVGGILAVGLTYLVSAAGNSLLRSYVEQRGNLELEGSVFAIEPWMIAMTISLATAIAAVAGLWPARKAARMDPIEAMGRL